VKITSVLLTMALSCGSNAYSINCENMIRLATMGCLDAIIAVGENGALNCKGDKAKAKCEALINSCDQIGASVIKRNVPQCQEKK